MTTNPIARTAAKTQVTVRLSNQVVEAMDGFVEAGQFDSRAAYLEQLARRDLRRKAAEHDAMIYATTPVDPELAAIVKYTSRRPLDLDD